MPSVWLATVSLENALGDVLHCGESQTRCWKKLPLFEKAIYLHLEAYSYVFNTTGEPPDSSFRTILMKFMDTSIIEKEEGPTHSIWEKTVNTRWALTLESPNNILEHLARGELLLIPLMSNERCIFVMLVDVISGDLVERRGIVRFDRLSDDEMLSFYFPSHERIDEIHLSSSRMVMVA